MKLFFISLLFFVSCTNNRDFEKMATVNINYDLKSAEKINIKSSTAKLLSPSSWGIATHPTTIANMDCFAAVVNWPILANAQNYCETGSGTEVFKVRSGDVRVLRRSANGLNFSMTIPVGLQRKFFIIGFKSSSSTCPTAVSTWFNG